MSESILLYDQDCGFCRWSVGKILRWSRSGALRAAPLQSREAKALLFEMEPSVRLDSAHLVSTGGHVYSAGAIADPILGMLPWGRPFAGLARIMPRTTERTYRLVARNRHRMGRWLGAEACAVPTGVTGSSDPSP